MNSADELLELNPDLVASIPMGLVGSESGSKNDLSLQPIFPLRIRRRVDWLTVVPRETPPQEPTQVRTQRFEFLLPLLTSLPTSHLCVNPRTEDKTEHEGE
jgi:hypothetical protein